MYHGGTWFWGFKGSSATNTWALLMLSITCIYANIKPLQMYPTCQRKVKKIQDTWNGWWWIYKYGTLGL